MDKQQKKDLVLQLKNDFHRMASIFFVNYQGLSVKDLQLLRRNIRQSGGNFQVAKVRLIKHAIQNEIGVSDLSVFCKGQLGVVFTEKKDHAIVKVLYDFAKSHAELKLVAGHYDSRILNKESLVQLALLPSREVLLAQIAGTMQNVIAQGARLIRALKEKREQEG